MFNRKFWKYLLITVAGLVLLLGIVLWSAHEPLPEYRTGPEADSLAQAMMQNLGYDAWKKTRAVTFTFKGDHHYAWDRELNRVRVEWGNQTVVLPLSDWQTGVATRNGQLLTGPEKQKALKKAWAFWCNDSFWLIAPFKCFDPGTERGIVDLEDGGQGLLVKYSSGGVTPGDAYLWLFDKEGRPKAWKMWVSIIPVGGVYSSWEDWKTLRTGAKIASLHKLSGFELRLSDIKGGKNWQELGVEPPSL